MEINNYSNVIQESCDIFLEKNLPYILQELNNNKHSIGRNFSEFKIKNINNKSWGIYVFYIKPKNKITTHQELNRLWETNSTKKKLTSPKVIKSRFKTILAHKSNCFYIGKSENLRRRIEQHIHQKTKSSTYGLKLSEHDKLHTDNTFEYSYFVFKENPKQNIDALKFLLVSMEKKLRLELSPLIGKQ